MSKSGISMSSEGTYFFYLPKGTFKARDIMSILGFCCDFPKKIVLEIENERFEMESDENGKELHFWNMRKYLPGKFSLNSIFTIEIESSDPIVFDLDEIVYVCQNEDKIDPIYAKNLLLFKFKAGYFARKQDYMNKPVSIEKPVFLPNSKKVSYENTCLQNKQLQSTFEDVYNNKFKTLFEQFQEFEKELIIQRRNSYKEYQKNTETTPLIHSNTQIERKLESKQMPQIERIEPIEIESAPVQSVYTFPEKENSKTPSLQEIKQFLMDLNSLFPLDVQSKCFCDIWEEDPDISNQRVFLFNVIHFLIMFSCFTGIKYDYRITMSEGVWKFDDRITGIEVKRDTMNKSNVFDNPYRKAIYSCIKKCINELHLSCKGNDIVSMISSLQDYQKKL